MIETYFTVAVVYIFIYNEYLFNMNIYLGYEIRRLQFLLYHMYSR